MFILKAVTNGSGIHFAQKHILHCDYSNINHTHAIILKQQVYIQLCVVCLSVFTRTAGLKLVISLFHRVMFDAKYFMIFRLFVY